MTTYLLHADSVFSPELRHEIGEAIGDPLIFIEHDDRRIVAGPTLERSTFERREDVVDEFWTYEDLGRQSLVRDPAVPSHHISPELVVRALQKLAVYKVSVPPSFPALSADYIRDKGIDVVIEPEAWGQRRRIKTPWELEGIERAQRATDTAMLTEARMLRDSEPTNGGALRFEGEILTADLLRIAMSAELLTQGAESEEILVQSGDACLRGHDLGTGPILPDQSCIIDCFPRERKSGVYSDTTRTFVPGTPSDELKQLHQHCVAAMEIALEAIKPGRNDAYDKVAEYFHDKGFPTQKHSEGPPPKTGFFHALGHGVGLQVHEKPLIGLRADNFIEGDVVAIEPGLYFPGIGGVRLEDTVMVTSSGAEHFTDPYPYDLEP